MSITSKTQPKKSSTVTFYVLHLPLLLLILGVLSVTTIISSKVAPKTSAEDSNEERLGYVLGDDSDEDEDSEEDDEKEDEDRDEDKDEDKDEDNEEGKDDGDEDKDDTENENEEEDEDDENETEEENESDEGSEDANENKAKTQERVENNDGTYSIIKTETEGDKVKVEYKTYDASGKLIKEEKHEGSDEGFESESEDSSGNKLKVRVQDNEVLLKREGVTGLNNFPMYVDETDGTVYVQTPKGDVRLGIMPQSIVEKAESLEDVDSVSDVELESDSDDKLEFKLKTKSAERLLGVFKLDIPSTVYFDAQDGEQTRSEQTFVTKILDFLSF